jgi:hypothetical protein
VAARGTFEDDGHIGHSVTHNRTIVLTGTSHGSHSLGTRDRRVGRCLEQAYRISEIGPA